jgi:hypothetical protein
VIPRRGQAVRFGKMFHVECCEICKVFHVEHFVHVIVSVHMTLTATCDWS